MIPSETEVEVSGSSPEGSQVTPFDLPTGETPTKITKTTKIDDSVLVILAVLGGGGAIGVSVFRLEKEVKQLR